MTDYLPRFNRLPDSLDHMLAFAYFSYSMVPLLLESLTSFEETWIECLGDLACYRMAIEEADLRDREIWSGVARMWYNKAADSILFGQEQPSLCKPRNRMCRVHFGPVVTC